jgi:glutathione S-transferase
MKLFYFYVAPNPTKVRLYLAEKAFGGAEIELEHVLVDYRKKEHLSPEHLARNPYGRLPVLQLDDGTYLTESLAIIEYLEDLHPRPDMLGASPLERARVREVERIADFGVLLPIARVVHATDSPLGLPPCPEMADFYRDRLAKSLEVLEGRLADGRPFVAGDRVTIADCTLQAALNFGRFRSVLPLDQSLERVAGWDRTFRERPSAQQVLSV